MFPRSLVVKVEGGQVTLSIRTNDSRVEVFTMTIPELRALIASATCTETHVHLWIQIVPYYRIVFAIYGTDWNVMLCEFNAQESGVR
jgi:hypothetical protein